MDIKTHEKTDQQLCGHPIALENGFSQVELKTTENMAVDGNGLVHGGFIFGLADYAAMIAVNHPFVVLGGADVKFLKPVKVEDVVIAEARVVSRKGKKQMAHVTVRNGDETVFEGDFACFTLDKHVLQ